MQFYIFIFFSNIFHLYMLRLNTIKLCRMVQLQRENKYQWNGKWINCFTPFIHSVSLSDKWAFYSHLLTFLLVIVMPRRSIGNAYFVGITLHQASVLLVDTIHILYHKRIFRLSGIHKQMETKKFIALIVSNKFK